MTQKQFKSALRKLRRYAQSRGVNVRVIVKGKKMLPWVGYFDPETRRVRISAELRKVRSEMIYILAHEIGHSIDFDQLTKKEKRRNDIACELFNKCMVIGYKVPIQLRNFILNRERTANKNGEQLIRQLGITLRKDLQRKYGREGIEGYRRLFSLSSSK